MDLMSNRLYDAKITVACRWNQAPVLASMIGSVQVKVRAAISEVYGGRFTSHVSSKKGLVRRKGLYFMKYLEDAST